jgi:hypothetical protein
MSGTTFKRRIDASRRVAGTRVMTLSSMLLPLLVFIAYAVTAFSGGGVTAISRPNLSQSAATVSCATAHDASNALAASVMDALKAEPDYTGVQAFGFTPPLYPIQIAPFRATIQARQLEVDAKAAAAADGTCVDKPTATITAANGQAMTLPLVDGSVGTAPVSGSVSNQDSRTVPVSIGTPGDSTRTNTWSELDGLYGTQAWYVDCANTNLAMSWGTDVPKYMATESKHDNRFILAVNVSPKLTDDQIRQQAATDGNPNTGKLSVVRVASIINTRHMANHRCDQFIDTRSMIRVSLGKVMLDAKGQFKSLETDKGIFVDCHNLWQLPKSPRVPIKPTPSTTGSTPPGTTPPGTTPPSTCTNGGVPPKCLQPKDPNQGAGHKGNVPTQVRGTNPPAPSAAEPKPPAPPNVYTPPAPPKAASSTTSAPPRTTPPPEPPAPPSAAPATGCVPPPGMLIC